jgi:hypothetical protein
MVRAEVRESHKDLGWGVLDSPETPGGCWTAAEPEAQVAPDAEQDGQGLPQRSTEPRGGATKLAGAVLLLAVVATSTTACESLAGGLDIVNETDQALYNVERIPPDGGRWRLTINDCSDADLEVTKEDGTVFAALTEKWCPGQVWTIRGKDDSVLEDG